MITATKMLKKLNGFPKHLLVICYLFVRQNSISPLCSSPGWTDRQTNKLTENHGCCCHDSEQATVMGFGPHSSPTEAHSSLDVVSGGVCISSYNNFSTCMLPCRAHRPNVSNAINHIQELLFSKNCTNHPAST